MSRRCCVFQPFDKGEFDKRYDDTVEPAIRAAELEPYRVDRDDGAIIPIETLHEEIRASVVCLADITTHNPNVMYEVGYAIASSKDVVLICSTLRPADVRFPFDLQHRGIIQYTPHSARDFEQLKQDITKRLKGVLKRQATVREIAAVSPVRSTEGLQPSEISALAFIMANRDADSAGVSSWTIKQDMESAGYNKLGANLALTRLVRLRLVEPFEDQNYNGEPFASYRLTVEGEDWLLSNQSSLELRVNKKPALPVGSTDIIDDDVPF